MFQGWKTLVTPRDETPENAVPNVTFPFNEGRDGSRGRTGEGTTDGGRDEIFFGNRLRSKPVLDSRSETIRT